MREGIFCNTKKAIYLLFYSDLFLFNLNQKDIKSNISESSREHENSLITNGALLPSFPSFDSIVEDEPTLDKVKMKIFVFCFENLEY